MIRLDNKADGKMVLRVILLFLFTCLLFACVPMQSGVQDMNQQLQRLPFMPRSETVTADTLNLRKEPSTKGRIVAQLKKGERVTIRGEEGRWVNVVTKWGRSGWVYNAYLTGFGGDAAPAPQPKPAPSKTVAKPSKPAAKAVKKDQPAQPAPPPAQPQKRPQEKPSMRAYKNPDGTYQLQYPSTWRVAEDFEADPQVVTFTAPSRAAELWVVGTARDLVSSTDDFYLDLVRPLAKQFQEQVVIDPLTTGRAGDRTWQYGRAVVSARPKAMYKYALTQTEKYYWSVVMVARDGITDAQIDMLNGMRESFNLAEAKSTAFVKKEAARQSDQPPKEKQAPKSMVFKRAHEPRERAFTVLIPQNWQLEGGILRVNPLTQGGPAQSIAAKLDLKLKKDAAGTVMEHWLPDIAWFDPRYSPAAQMGAMPAGSNYQGMTVMPLMPAQEFLRRVVFPQYHRAVTQVEIVDTRSLPKLAQAFHQITGLVVPMLAPHMRYDAALMRVRYTEAGRRYEELLVTVIEDMGQAGAGMWNNKLTFYMRAPAGEYSRWEPIFAVINQSIKIDPRWMAGEVKGQLTRSKILDKTQKEIQRIGREITEHRYRTNAEIQNDMFLTLMNQEEYVNPYTKEVEIGTDQWKNRWVNESGDVIYTDDEYYNPNTDVHLNRSDYKRTPIRKRFPQ